MMSGLLGIAACSHPPVTSGPLFGTGVFHPPPKPGDSISQTRLCECKACEPRNCCDGPDDDAPPKSCGESYDFSDPACGGIEIRSCTSRCSREVWRVHSGEDCSTQTPPLLLRSRLTRRRERVPATCTHALFLQAIEARARACALAHASL